MKFSHQLIPTTGPFFKRKPAYKKLSANPDAFLFLWKASMLDHFLETGLLTEVCVSTTAMQHLLRGTICANRNRKHPLQSMFLWPFIFKTSNWSYRIFFCSELLQPHSLGTDLSVSTIQQAASVRLCVQVSFRSFHGIARSLWTKKTCTPRINWCVW